MRKVREREREQNDIAQHAINREQWIDSRIRICAFPHSLFFLHVRWREEKNGSYGKIDDDYEREREEKRR